jgi:hypothetical protein
MIQKVLKYFFLFFTATVFLATSSGFMLYTSPCHCKEKQENCVSKEKSCCHANKQAVKSKCCCHSTNSKQEKSSTCNRCNGEKIFVKLPVTGTALQHTTLKNNTIPFNFGMEQKANLYVAFVQIYKPETIKPPGYNSAHLYCLNSSFLI